MNKITRYAALMVTPETREIVRAEAKERGMKMCCLVDRMVENYISQKGNE